MRLKMIGQFFGFLYLVFLIWVCFMLFTDRFLSCTEVDEKYGYIVSSCEITDF